MIFGTDRPLEGFPGIISGVLLAVGVLRNGGELRRSRTLLRIMASEAIVPSQREVSLAII
jgi:hypothetical protein